MNGNVIRTITIRGTSEGLDKLTADVNKLATAQEHVAVVSEQSAKRVLSLEDAWKKQTLRLDEAARAQANIARETKIADAALREGLATQQQHAQRLDQINQRYTTAAKTTQEFGKQTGLARHELINLGRQAQDVGVSLASGQSPFMVLVQQGSQIADVFATSGGTVRGFFTQAIGWAGRFAMSTAGVVTGITAIGGAALYMGASFAAAQREIDKVLSGVGAGSGVTRGGINRIAEGAAGGSLSIGAAREAAVEFAKTGKIYEQNINTATNVTREFAQVAGIDAADATKQLAAALADPAKGALELNKSIRFLDADTLKYITTLQSMGQLQQAQNALMIAMLPALAKQAENVGLLTRAWNAATTAVSDYADAAARAVARGAERLTGAGLGGFTNEEKLAELRQRRDAMSKGVFGQGVATRDINILNREIAQLEQKMADLAKQSEAVSFAQLSLDARAFGQSIDQTGTQIEKLTAGLAKIAEYQAARLNQGLGVDPALERQAQIGSVILAQSLQQQQAEQSKARIIADNAMQYQNVSVSTAQTLVQMEAQLGVAQAVTGAAEMDAQHWATIVSLLGTANLSLVTQEQLTSAIAIADRQRAISIALANTQAEHMLHSLQVEGQLLDANTDREKAAIKARQTYSNLVDKNVDQDIARAVANQEHSNALKEISKQEEAATRAIERQIAAINTAADAWRLYTDGVISWSVANDEAGKATRRLAAATEDASYWANRLASSMFEAGQAALIANSKFVPFATTWAGMSPTGLGTGDSQFRSNQGGISQFNPAGYTSTTMASGIMAQWAAMLDPAKIDEARAKSFEQLVGSALSTGGVEGALQAALGQGDFGKQDWATSMVQSLTNLLPEDKKVGSLQQQIGLLQQQPATMKNMQLMQQLNDQLASLTRATDDNTSATSAQTDVLSPFYSSDPRQTHLGFRAFAGGGIMTPYGELPLKHYAGGGMATSPQVAVFGEGSTPEAYVPVPAGRIPVEVRTPANTNQKQQRPVTVNILVQGNADSGTVSALKQTAFQQAQAMRRIAG